MREPVTTACYETLWRFVAERQAIFWRRREGAPAPWSDDPILQRYKFTNIYRINDRVSQFLLRSVIMAGDQGADEMVFRVLLFKLFNRIETWQLLQDELGEVRWSTFSFDRYDRTLTAARANRKKIYSAAYIMPMAKIGKSEGVKHRSHLQLLQHMMDEGIVKRILASQSLKELYMTLRTFPMLGPFLAYQYAIDLNYTSLINFSEQEFVVAGPGALRGIRQCFSNLGGRTPAEIIRWVMERQEAELAVRGLRWKNLFGRPMQLIDVQNVFCEVDKYLRAGSGPRKRGERTRIKQNLHPSLVDIDYMYPVKWGIRARAL